MKPLDTCPPIRVVLTLVFLASAIPGLSALAQQDSTSPPHPATPQNSRVPEWTADARWYYVKIPRFQNGDPLNDPEGTLPWTSQWPPLEPEESAPREKTGEYLLPHARQYGGDLRGVIRSIPYLKNLGVNAICLSPVFHGSGEFKISQVDLRHVDDFIGVKGGITLANREGSQPDSWVWTPSDMALRELIHTAHENGMRVVISGIFQAVMSANSPPSEQEHYYLSATRRWMDPDGDGNPQDGVDGWLASPEEGPLRQFDDKYKAFWSRWRVAVMKANPDAVVIGSGTLALAQLAGGPFDIAIDESASGTISGFFGVQRGNQSQTKAFFDLLESTAAIAPAETAMGNISLLSGGNLHARLLTAVGATEPLRKGRQVSPGPVPDDAARARWKLATITQHFLPGTVMTWYGDEVGMFGGPGEYAGAPMWWSDRASYKIITEHFRADFFVLVQWLHHLRQEYPVLRKGAFRRVLMDDTNKVLAFARSMPNQEIVLVINYGDAKQLVMLPAGKPGQMVGVRCPHLSTHLGAKKPVVTAEDNRKFAPLSVAGARQFVNPEGKIRMWLDPMSVRIVFLGTEN